MPDFRVADTAPEHPKLRRAGLAAAGLWATSGAWAMRELTDGWVPDYYIRSWPSGRRLAGILIDVGLWTPEKRGDLAGYRFHDWADYQRTTEQLAAATAATATRRAVYADPVLVAAVRTRDQDRCRYCGRRVNWRDRRGAGGATFDHVNPLARDGSGDNSPGNVVVACRGCNASKRDRTPEQAGMTLRPPPDQPPSAMAQNQIGSSSRPSSDLDPEQVGFSPPHPHPVPSSGAVGGGSSRNERAKITSPPRCEDHQDWPADQPIPRCGGCRRVRLAAEQHAADQHERAELVKAHRRRAIDACPGCDEFGMRDMGDLGVARCSHPDLDADTA
jgi:hypothetical protein